jgi:DNA-binding NarL/FixJ family response regulator
MSLTRLRCFLYSLCKTEEEALVIDMICQGYELEEIAERLNVHSQTIKNILGAIRKRCQKADYPILKKLI